MRSADTGKEVKGWFVACPLTARQMLELPEPYVLKKIIQAAKKAEELGAKIVGLGAFTSVVADAGISVDKAVGIPVTTGNSYTVATALLGIEHAAQLLGKDLAGAKVTVLGASGSIGKACARIMARRGHDITLVARRRGPLEEAADIIRSEAGVTPRIETDIETALQDADVVIAVTSAVDAVVDGRWLKSGAIVCDVARPRNVARPSRRHDKMSLSLKGEWWRRRATWSSTSTLAFRPKRAMRAWPRRWPWLSRAGLKALASAGISR